MNLLRLASSCLMLLATTGLLHAEISQYFDRAGRILPAGRKLTLPQSQRMIKYTVPEGIQLRSDVHYEFYPVFGKTFAEIVGSTEENSPRNNKTRKRQSTAYDWSLGWTYDYSFSLEPDDESEKVHCDLTVVNPLLSYDITVTLPALTDDSALNPMEKDLWKNYVATLLERLHGRVKIIKDDTKDEIIRQFSEIAYLSLNEDEAANADRIVERFVRTETEQIGSNIIRQIQQKLEVYDSEPVQDSNAKPAKTLPRRRITR